MFRKSDLLSIALALLLGALLPAQAVVSVDRLDGVEPGAPAPANLVVVDVIVDVATTDAWAAAGIRATTANGATLVYGTSGALINPGLADRFVTCVSKPLAVNANARFDFAAAAIAGRYNPTGPTATATASELNATWFASPPVNSTSPSVDGFIARVVINIAGATSIDPATITVATGAPPAGSVPLLVSQPPTGTASLGTATTTFDVPALSGINWNVHAFSLPPSSVDFRKLMITEVSWGDPDGLEITNFSTAAINLTGWTAKWRDAAVDLTSSPLNVVIAPGEVIVVKEAGGTLITPAGIQVLSLFPNITTTNGSFAVALVNPLAVVADEVHVSDTAGAYGGFNLGGVFRGLALRGALAGSSGDVGVERIWGLDSDGGTDWTEQPERSFGRENRSSGPRGNDPAPMSQVRITEIDDSPDYLELHNPGASTAFLQGWFLVCGSLQGSSLAFVKPFPGFFALAAGGFVVIGNTAVPPAELPVGVGYVNLAIVAGSDLMPFGNGEYHCALYDNLGRLADAVRVAAPNSSLVHNHPRAPSHWADFTGAALRTAQSAPGEGGIALGNLAIDTNTGTDWRSAFTRTMGFSNAGFATGPGHGDTIDVRLNEGPAPGNGLTFIINAGPARAGFTYSIAVGVGHQSGLGPFFGLGADALFNYLQFYGAPLFTGILDARGSFRFDFDPNTVGPGIATDDIFLLQSPSGALVARTLVVMWDT